MSSKVKKPAEIELGKCKENKDRKKRIGVKQNMNNKFKILSKELDKHAFDQPLLDKSAGKISNALKILLTTDGSVTDALEAVYGKICVKAVSREMYGLSSVCFKYGFQEKALIVREAEMSFKTKVLVRASSFIALNLMPKKVVKDLMSGKLPIGKIIKKHKLETRREILSIKYDKQNKCFNRTYKIIFGRKPVILINESFATDI
ncbi:MAG: chorismate pyruvate-lyase family protein [Endomicrobium sp.]|nr:chorismate pyruvate-lyase family protein [Endomicrobium sp.]